jgi:polyhydroxyalkanoate synthesis regulator phasin
MTRVQKPSHTLGIAVFMSLLLLNVFIVNGFDGKNDIKKSNIINELVKTGKFTEDEAKQLVTKVMLINELVKTGKFTEDEAKQLVTKLMQDEQGKNQNQNENQTKIKTNESTVVFKSNAPTNSQPINFETQLKGDNELPPVNTTATGNAKFTWRGDNDTIISRISVSGITNITGAGLYERDGYGIGQPIVDLLKSSRQNNADDTLILNGDIKASDLRGVMKGNTMEDLRAALVSNFTYVNIHTSDRPNGEISGQIKVSSNETQLKSFNATTTGVP